MFTLNHTVKPLIIYQDQFCLLIIKLIVLSKERTKGAFQSDFLAATNTEEAQLYQKGNSLHFFHSDLLIPYSNDYLHSYTYQKSSIIIRYGYKK